MSIGPFQGVAYTHEAVTSTTAVAVPTASKLLTTLNGGQTMPCIALLFQTESVAIRYTVDGTAPAASGAGHPVAVATVPQWIFGQANCANFKFINDTGSGTSTVRITYFRG